MVDLAVHVAEELADKPYTAVIYHFLDNNFYFTQSEDGSKRPAKKGPDGNYHFEGDVVLADKDGEFAILNLCEPLWEAAKGKNMVVVVPMARSRQIHHGKLLWRQYPCRQQKQQRLLHQDEGGAHSQLQEHKGLPLHRGLS